MISGFETPTQLWLEIPASVQAEAWQQSQSLADPSHRWTAYLNRLCANTFLHWWREYHSSQSSANGQLADPSTSPDLWAVVNGSALTLDQMRLVIIPSEAIDISELRTPQEWVDIPGWAGDYYLAAQVNPDECWIRVWGYTSHHQIKANGSYEGGDRTYTLTADALIPDLTVLWVIQQLGVQEVTRAALSPLPDLTPEQVESVLQQTANSAYPRLSVSFATWGALLQNPDWRSQLLDRYQSLSFVSPATPSVSPATPPIAVSAPVRLSQWFQNVFEEGWESLEALFGETNLVYSFRRAETLEGIQRVKLVSLETPFQPQSAVLLISLTPEADGRVEVQVQLRPTPGDAYLPSGVTLKLLSMASQPLQFSRSRQQDNYIQLKRFKCLPGWEFILTIELGEVSITEHFVS